MTENLIKCTAKDRRKQIANSKLNGIDYIEVITIDSNPCSTARLYLIVYLFKKLNSVSLDKYNIKIEGGTKIKNIHAEWTIPYINAPPEIHDALNDYIDDAYKQDNESTEKVLIVYPSSNGDFSTYTLRIVNSLNPDYPPEGFDLMLSNIDFSFKIDCPSKFDCKPISPPNQEIPEEIVIDYLSKDYASFRHLVLSRLALLIPNWTERNVADMGIMMAELLAYAGDYLSYYQDAVATEAYLGTARSRISVKRHARLLDYYMHSGCNARVWICIEANEKLCVPQKTKFLTGLGNGDLVVNNYELEKELSQGTKVFEAMHDLAIDPAHNTIEFYTWRNLTYCLPKGSTQAALFDGDCNVAGQELRILNLAVGDVLIFQETHSREGVAADRDASHRHAVRITGIKKTIDALSNPKKCVLNVEWGSEDALPFSLCLCSNAKSTAVAHGNVLLADYGVSLEAEKLVDPDVRLNFRPRLKRGPLTFRGSFNASTSAFSAFNYDPQDVCADIILRQLKRPPKNEFVEFTDDDWLSCIWMPQQDLFSSNKFQTDFVVETESDGIAVIRFGDGVHGLNPQTVAGEAPETFYGFYRIGNGVEGNVGAESIKRVISSSTVDLEGGILSICNPLPAKGGVDPETMAMVRYHAPEAAKINERAITDADYADIVKRKCSEVQSAVAKTRWTGSWYTIYILIDRFGRKPIDEAFKTKIKNLLERYRLSGRDIEIQGPKYVPIEIEVTVNVSSDTFCEAVEQKLIEVFSNHTLANGLCGFFHPDNFTFGQPLLLRDLSETIAKVDGVASFLVTKFNRTDNKDSTPKGAIQIKPYEIIQLDNDFNYPENGCITFNMKGGR
ncbi:MAG: putative baseplate assembly protein [Nitrososphaerota archaeon]|jgi:hypothetical protein|nr:putative baseplate assembly protein [Nitrososphaerota archaeon]